jgi:hypothetical protein
MRSAVGFVGQFLGMSLLGAMSVATLPSYPRENLCKLPVAAVLPNSPVREQNNTTEDLFRRLNARHRWQETRLIRLSGVRTYKLENSEDKIVAEEAVVVEYRAPATETFTTTSGKGSGFVRHRVFQRLMKVEEKRIRVNKDPDSLITPENYAFDVVGTDRIGNSHCSVVHAVPKRKEMDLFEGKIWIDNQDSAIVKITGHLAKSPSFWVKQVDFVRDYQKIDGFWLLSREEAVSAIRIFGKETLTVDYQNYTRVTLPVITMNNKAKAGGKRLVYLAAGISALGGMLFGYDIGVISGAILFIKSDFRLSPSMEEIVVSSVLLGSLVGAAVGGVLADRIGRRRLLIITAVVFGVGAIGAALAPPESLPAARSASLRSSHHFTFLRLARSISAESWFRSIKSLSPAASSSLTLSTTHLPGPRRGAGCLRWLSFRRPHSELD